MHRKIVPIHSAQIPIMGRDRDLCKISIVLSHKGYHIDTQDNATIRVAKQLTIPTKTESPVIVVTSYNGLMNIEGIQSEKQTKNVLHAR